MTMLRPSQLDQAGAAADDVMTWDGSEWGPAPPLSGGVPVAFGQRTAGDVTAPNGLSAWAAVDTGLDLTVPAVAGDVIEIGLTASWGSSSTVNGRLRAVSMVGGVVTNVLAGSTNYGVAAWSNPLGVQYSGAAGTVMYTVLAGDLSGGSITVRLQVRADGTGQQIRGNADAPLHFSLKNLGQ